MGDCHPHEQSHGKDHGQEEQEEPPEEPVRARGGGGPAWRWGGGGGGATMGLPRGRLEGTHNKSAAILEAPLHCEKTGSASHSS